MCMCMCCSVVYFYVRKAGLCLSLPFLLRNKRHSRPTLWFWEREEVSMLRSGARILQQNSHASPPSHLASTSITESVMLEQALFRTSTKTLFSEGKFKIMCGNYIASQQHDQRAGREAPQQYSMYPSCLRFSRVPHATHPTSPPASPPLRRPLVQVKTSNYI